MQLETLDFCKLLPAFMRSDKANQALASGLNEWIPPLAARARQMSTWDVIDQLEHVELDALAQELNILWYDTGAELAVKRDLIKNSDLVYRRLGTKWAAESVIRSYFEKGYITEWFEYGGKPGTFRICATVPAMTQDKMQAFLGLFHKVKRASAQLERMEIENPPLSGMCYIGGTLVPYHQTTNLPPYLPEYAPMQANVNGALYSAVTIKLPPAEVN